MLYVMHLIHTYKTYDKYSNTYLEIMLNIVVKFNEQLIMNNIYSDG